MLTLPTFARPAAPQIVVDSDLAQSEHAVSVFRRYLRDAGLGDWRILQGHIPYLYKIDDVLDRLDPDAVWESADLALVADEPMTSVVFDDEDDKPVASVRQGGALHLRELRVVIARWFWYDPHYLDTRSFHLIAAPQLACVDAFRQKLLELKRTQEKPVWQITGDGGEDETPRGRPEDHDVLLSDALRERVKTDVLGFFTPEVRRVHERLNVPYRRGVLLHGEPGNGKTSLIRWIGASLPHVTCTLLRAGHEFNTDTLVTAFKEWKQNAPAILVIEDLTSVIERVNLSTLLNLLDGIDRKTGDGLMLIASTNHPDKLDSALSNRPGRFDVVLELPPPDDTQRRDYLRSRLLEVALASLDAAVDATRSMSFSHLEEVVRLSGMIAVREGRDYRESADLDAAVGHVRDAFNRARHGYAKLPEVPFGLMRRRS